MKKLNNNLPKEPFLKRVGKRKGLVAIGIIVLLSIVFLVIKLVQSSDLVDKKKPTYSVHILRKEDPILFDGIVQASEIQEEYYDASEGTLSEVLIENGQNVEAGTNLFTYTNEENQKVLDEQNRQYSRIEKKHSEVVTNLANAREELKTANANIENNSQAAEPSLDVNLEESDRTKELENSQNKLITYETNKAEAKATIESAEIAIKELNEQKEDIEYEIERLRDNVSNTVQARIAGVIELEESNTDILKSRSEKPILRLVSHELIIAATVSEYDYNKVKVDAPVQINLMTSNKVLNGKISQVGTLPLQSVEKEPSSRYSFVVVPDEVIQYGFSVQVGIEENIIYLPYSTIIEREGKKKYVFVNKKGQVERRKVEGTKKGNFFILDSGVKIDEEVIIDPDPKLLDGDEVKVNYD